uniref:Serine/threonine-protein kinase 1 n=1 Tax=Knipowitschia caucasica TaxID=637954 RepID=A0AAV2LQ06_KNICA
MRPLRQNTAVSLFDWFESDLEILIVMERPSNSIDHLEYSVLHEPQPKDTIRDIIKQLAQDHKNWVFHRDIKTANILMQDTQEGARVRIVDFGCSCAVSTTLGTWALWTSALRRCSSAADAQPDLPQPDVWQIRAIAYEFLNGDAITFEICEWLY